MPYCNGQNVPAPWHRARLLRQYGTHGTRHYATRTLLLYTRLGISCSTISFSLRLFTLCYVCMRVQPLLYTLQSLVAHCAPWVMSGQWTRRRGCQHSLLQARRC
jgi:hypothetical protein